MKNIKGIAIGLLSFSLFILLIVFGVAYTVHQIALNPGFVTGVINDIDFSDITQEAIGNDDSFEIIPVDLKNAVIDTIDKIEPAFKANLTIAVNDTYDYLLGKNNAPDFKKALGDSFLNSNFVTSLLENIDLSRIADQVITEQASGTQTASDRNFQQVMIASIDKLEPSLKKQIVAASDPVFKYLLQKTSGIDLKTTVRQSILSKEFVTALIDSLDLNLLTKDVLSDQLEQLPQGINLTDQQIDRILVVMEPVIKSGLKNAADPIADYLIGSQHNFSVTVSLQSAMQTVKTVAREAFITQSSTELTGFSQKQIDQAFNDYWTDAQQTIPVAFEFNSTSFGSDIVSQMNDILSDGQDGLTEVRQSIDEVTREVESRLGEVRPYIRMFQIGYAVLIALMVLIVIAIVLIKRSVKGVCRDLGITFLSYGAIWFAGIMVGRYVIKQMIPKMDIPVETMRSLIEPITIRATSPLFAFSLACLIVGVILIVVSFVYWKQTPEQTRGLTQQT